MLKLNFLILDCGCENFGHGGTLNHFFTATAKDLLTELGHNVEVTRVGDEWSIPEEVKKILKADVIIVQTPGWCMGPPWQFKRYENMVLVQPEVCGTDGRHSATPNEGYGSGGFLTDKKYLLSSTWNAPLAAFEEKDQFFGGIGIDGVLLPVHKNFQFLGMKPLPSFMANDVVKNPQIPQDIERFKEHLRKLFS